MESILIENRKKLDITGATKMLSSTGTQAVVEVGDCNVIITGTNIEITKLDLDNKQVSFNGDINSVKYNRKTEKVGLVKRLFR
ncbi:MAG: hypothetical protein K2K31_02270 [Clostridia bacterium]|nr:hypothetical protein [Clostridia bacterium]